MARIRQPTQDFEILIAMIELAGSEPHEIARSTAARVGCHFLAIRGTLTRANTGGHVEC
jgi:hypothetical protein